MALSANPQWKEEMVITDEERRSFIFECGWGADPPVAYVPAQDEWAQCVPDWLAERREEVIQAMRGTGHRVKESAYAVLQRPNTESS